MVTKYDDGDKTQCNGERQPVVVGFDPAQCISGHECQSECKPNKQYA